MDQARDPRMRRAGPLSNGAALVAVLLGLAPGVADPAPAAEIGTDGVGPGGRVGRVQRQHWESDHAIVRLVRGGAGRAGWPCSRASG